MSCCPDLEALIDRGWVRNSPLGSLTDGRILTEFNTEFFFIFGEDRPTYVGLHYCPFCGRALSVFLWNREKKK